jgi:hypothetical protein
MSDAFLYFGDTLKALDDNGRVGGYLIRFSDDGSKKDLANEYFTSSTYLGKREGDGVDVMFHHGLPLPHRPGLNAGVKKELIELEDRPLGVVKTTRDAIGIWAETVLNMADEYEKAVFGVVKLGKVGWSSGAVAHLVRKSSDGQITRWPIGEASITPQPCEPLNRTVTLKAIESLKFVPLDEDESNQPTLSDIEQKVNSFDDLDLESHSQLTVSVLRGFGSRLRGNHEARLKAGRVLSEKNRQRIKDLMGQLMSVHDDLMGLMEASMPMEDAEKRAKETAHFMAKYPDLAKRG